MEKHLYGYVRVSSREQNIERQVISLKEFGVKKEAEKILIVLLTGE